jgi:hypothetical protein
MDRWNSHKIEIVNNYRKYLMDNRPKHDPDFWKEVWAVASNNGNKKVFDPNDFSIELLKNKYAANHTEFGAWELGHVKKAKYSELVDELISGQINEAEFIQRYRDKNNYVPEDISSNRSHRNE